jgi:hypothetical protein
MDNGTLALMIPVLALAIPVCAVVMNGLTKIWQLKVQEAQLRTGPASPEQERLIEQMADMRRELDEVHERLDFTERMLAQAKQPPQLPRAE